MIPARGYEPELFRYESILDETTLGIQLLLKTEESRQAVWLSKRCVILYRHLNEVEIPAWLCKKTGLLVEMESHEKRTDIRQRNVDVAGRDSSGV
jgi:hypothetical protein